jgi:hypothetical protein
VRERARRCPRAERAGQYGHLNTYSLGTYYSKFWLGNCCNTHPQRRSDGRKPNPPYHKCGNNAEERTMTANENKKLCMASKPSYSWLLSSILLIHSSHPTSHPSSFSIHLS